MPTRPASPHVLDHFGRGIVVSAVTTRSEHGPRMSTTDTTSPTTTKDFTMTTTDTAIEFPASAFPTDLLERAHAVNAAAAASLRESEQDGSIVVVTADGIEAVEADYVAIPLTPEKAAEQFDAFADMAEMGVLGRGERAALMMQVSAYLLGFAQEIHESGTHREDLCGAILIHEEQAALHGTLAALQRDEYTSDIAESAAQYLRARYEHNMERAAALLANAIHELAN